jgi:very-short-patch-repair endonuclease
MLKCKVCGKEFQTTQSLGGHVSSHFRTKTEKITSIKQCKYCNGIFENGWKLGAHIINCKANPNIKQIIKKRSLTMKGIKPSIETKIKISNSLKLAHKENRAWNIGKSRWNNDPSYPETFFMKVIKNEFLDKSYVREYSIGKYSIDFAWPHKKIAIEIDGQQHQRFKEYVERDAKKDEYLKNHGWLVLRLNWVDVYNDPKRYINEANSFVGS